MPKRKYTHSAKSLAQRKTAAVKTGEHSQEPVVQAGVPPCAPSTCPRGEDEHPCDARRDVDERGGAWSFCVPALFETHDLQEQFAAALDGDPTKLRPFVTSGLAAQAATYQSAAQSIAERGAIVEVQLDDGRTVLRTHPGVDVLARLAPSLGLRASDQLITPRHRSAANLGDRMVDALDTAMANRKALAEGAEGAVP